MMGVPVVHDSGKDTIVYWEAPVKVPLTSLGLDLSICKMRILTFNLQRVVRAKMEIYRNVRRF